MDLYTQTYQNIPKGWEKLFSEAEPELKQISDLLEEEKKKGKRIVPLQENIFKVFHMIEPKDVTVVLFGQDPYFQVLPNGKPRALGFSFSVDKTDELPSSLRNIYKEIVNCYPEVQVPTHGDISHWVIQGVMLLNICLTCVAYEPNSHGKYKLWMPFMNRFMKFMVEINKQLIFVLWGGEAQKLEQTIEKKGYKNILKSVHPSGLSANRGFFGCRHFVMINEILQKNGRKEIQWLPRNLSKEELRCNLIAELTNPKEMDTLTKYYEPYYTQQNHGHMNHKTFAVLVLTHSIYTSIFGDGPTYEKYLERIQKRLEADRSLSLQMLASEV